MVDPSSSELVDLYEKVARHDPGFTEVNFPADLFAEDEMVRLMEALKRNPHVRKINFQWAERTPELIRQLAALLGGGEENNTAAVIRHVVLPYRISNSEFLLVSRNGLCSNETVKVLDLRSSGITGREGGEIMEELLLQNQSLEEIDLSSNFQMSTEAWAGIARALRDDGCCRALTKLDLSVCRAGNAAVVDLSNAVRRNNSLEVLDIGDNCLTRIGFPHVMDMLEANSSLKVLRMGYSELDRDSSTARETPGDGLSRALRNNTSLKTLYLYNCGLSGADLSPLFRTLTGDNQTLTSLEITDSQTDEASMTDLARCLPDMKGLEEISFTWYKGMKDDVWRGVMEGLRANRSLVRVEAGEPEDDEDHDDESDDDDNEGVPGEWDAWSQFFPLRNRLRPLLEATSTVEPPPVVGGGLWPYVLEWCNGPSNGDDRTDEATVSLIHHILHSTGANSCLFGMVNIRAVKRTSIQA